MTHKNPMEAEVTIKAELKEMVKIYTQGLKDLESVYGKLTKKQEQLPQKWVDKENFEDDIILASQLKHQSIQFWQKSMALVGSIDADYDYISGQLRLNVAESVLREKGFDRVTDILREGYLRSIKEISEFSKIQDKIKSISDALEKLIRAFESDETNCRRFLERQNKIRGLQ